ncbi:MAG TPA: hypothetical protein VE404_06020, partial [Verrucomicrobiae bacterium]|nr:hypothetical protein [Verrucomicrobiae bacterium]
MNSPRTGLLANIRDRSARRLLRAAREEARDSSSAVYLVGGSVRDLVLGAGLRDIDLVVAGD